MRILLTFVLLCLECQAASLQQLVSAWTNGPYISFVGDSICQGYTNYSKVYNGGPSGDINFDIAHVLIGASGGVVTATNFGVNGRTLSQLAATDADIGLSVKPKLLFIHCGINDIADGVTWSSALSSLNAIAAKCASSNALLVVDEIFPNDNGGDSRAETIRLWNTNLAAWVASNAKALLISHDELGQIRESTGYKDDFADAYSLGDGTHISELGYAKWGQLIYALLLLDADTAPPFRAGRWKGAGQ